jgi:hypothetical protein
MSYLMGEADHAAMETMLEELHGHVRSLSTELARLMAKEDRLAAVLDACDQAEFEATRWAEPFRVPKWVSEVRTAAVEGRDLATVVQASMRGLDMNHAVWLQIRARREELDKQINQTASREASEGDTT